MAGCGRLRHAFGRSLTMLGLTCAIVACTESTHTVGIYDLNASSGTGGRHVNGQAGTGGSSGTSSGSGGDTTPIDDGSTGLIDAAIPDATQACPDSIVPTVRKRLDMYFLIDTNFFASADENWRKVVAGVEKYSRRDEAAGTGLGLRVIDPPAGLIPIIPTGETCDPETYARVSAVIGPDPLPANVDEIANALSNVTASLTTPLDPALAGGIQLARSRRSAYPDREQVVVLLSDAFFDFSCGSSVDDLIRTSATGLHNGIRSYMVELLVEPLGVLMPIITGLPVPTKIALQPVAKAGGTFRSHTLNMAEGSAADLSDILLEIQRDAEPCEYLLPLDSSWDETLLAVDTGVGPGPIPRVADEAACADLAGAYLNPATGINWVRACPASCAAIKETARPALWIVGCDPSNP